MVVRSEREREEEREGGMEEKKGGVEGSGRDAGDAHRSLRSVIDEEVD